MKSIWQRTAKSCSQINHVYSFSDVELGKIHLKTSLVLFPGGGGGPLSEKGQHCRGAEDRRESVSTADNSRPWALSTSSSLEHNQ